ncbi:cytochrome P450 [Kocuria palustris]|nr:cytochrome P450 [Kocuria palustris]MCM3332450.1 cytochrome P450 [Kocuria palustris]
MTATADSTDARRDPSQAREAPVADWVTIPELYRDPFPIFECLRAEGGIHWVPAVGRYLISSYSAVHETELDQTVYSANEEGSLQKRAMGHSMLRKDDPDHHGERKAWQPVLRPSAVKKAWRPIFEQNTQRYLEQMRAKGPEADLVWDFAAPYAAENLRAITGLHNVTQQDMQRWSQTMIDATGNYADDPEVWARGEASFDEVDAAIDEMLSWHRRHPDDSVLSALVAAPEQQMPIESIRANMKMTIGGGLNEPRDALGMAVWAMLDHPEQLAMAQADPALWHSVFDEAIRWVAPIGMYSRQTTREVVLEGVRLPAGAKLGICLLSANRDETQWPQPERFDLTRRDQGAHLAFGKGVHVCLGAWVARAEVADVALPAIFRELPHLRLDPQRPAVPGGWVFRGMDEFPVLTDDPASSGSGSAAGTDSAATTTADAPTGTRAARIAVVGAGPAGCYTAQAVLRRLPAAQISVLDSRPAPFGLVRSGVAADHQGTKSVTEQFSRLFEAEGVEFIGSVRVHSGECAEDVVLRG